MNLTDLLKKYNVPSPRYTSYPTVPYWQDTPTEAEWIENLQKELAVTKGGAGVYLHIPFCRSLCTYCGCNTRIARNAAVGPPYVDDLLKEWQTYRHRLGLGTIRVSEVHLGGGTPTFLSPSELSRLFRGLFPCFDFLADCERSIEADPRVTTPDHLDALREYGFTRLSLGIQDFDPQVQAIVNRVQSVESVAQVVDWARAKGFMSIGFDLIYGLPLQTVQSIENTIRAVRQIRPTQIAFYSYAHVPWIKASQRRFTEKDLPNGDNKRRLYERGLELLAEAGYEEVGMDHFALPDSSLWKAKRSGALHRNFMGYLPRHVSPLIGLGVSAIGDSWTCFSQNEKHLETYRRRVAKGEIPILRGHKLSAEDLCLRQHILNLMTKFETTWESTQGEFVATVGDRLAEVARDALIDIGPNQVRLRQEGRPFLRNVCMAFDAHLHRKKPETRVFSQSI